VRRGRASLAFALAALGAGLALAGSRQDPSPAPTPTPAPTAAAPETTPAAAAPAAEAASEAPKCADCHTDLVAAWPKNPHARYSGKGEKPDPEEMCATCHGDGAKHIEEGGDTAFIQVPRGAAGSGLRTRSPTACTPIPTP
jgi:hypothetical protein